MDIHDKTKEQLIADLQELREQNSKLKSQLDGISFLVKTPEKDQDINFTDFDYFELIFNTSPDIAIISRLSDSKVIKVNEGFSKITGYSREEALNGTRFNTNLWQNPDDRTLLLTEIQKHGSFENIETTMVRKDGTSFRALVSARLFEFQGEHYASSISRDITDLKNAEDLLRKSQNEIQNKFAALNSIFESSQNIIIFSLDVNYCYIAFTTLHKQTMKLIWGVDIAVGMNMLELIQNPADRKKAKDNFDQVLKGNHLRFEEEYGDSNLHRAYYEDIYNPIIDNKGDIVGLSVFVIDITDRKNAEKKNESTQKLLEDSQRIGKVGGWELNTDSMELHWTSEMYAIHEVDSTFKPLLDERQNFFTPESLIAIDEAVKQTIRSGEPYDIEVEIITAKGNRKSIRTIGKSDLANHRVVGYFQDITEQKLAEKEKKASDELFKHIFEYSNAGKSITMPDGQVNTNKAFRDILGYESDEFQHINWMDITHPDDIELTFNQINRLKTGEVKQVRFSKRFLHKNGSVVWADLSSTALQNKQGELQCFITTILDITERKLAEQALKESEEKYRFIVDNAIEGIYRTTIDGKALMANRALATMLGYASAEEYLNEVNDAAHQLWISPEQRAEYISLLDKQDIIQGYECQMKKKDGTPVWVSTNAKIVRDEAGNKIYSEGFTEEITSRKNVETELKRQIQLFNSLINNLSIGVFMVEAPTGKPLIANNSALHLLGRGILPDASKKNLAEVYKAYKNDTNQPYPVDEMPIVRGMYGEYSQIDDMIVQRPDGTKTHLEIVGSPVKDEEGNIWASLVSFEDITKRKQAEQALKESEKKYRTLADNTEDIINRFDRNYKHLYASPSAFKITGIKHQDYIGKSHRDLGFPTENCDLWEKTIQSVFDSGKSYNLFMEFEGRTGKVYLDWLLSPEFDNENNIISVLGHVRDITEIKKIEQTLKYSKQQYEHLFEFSGAGMIIHDDEGKYLMVNKTAAQHFGLPASEIVGKSIFDFFPAEIAQYYYNQNKFLIKTDGHKEYEESFELNGKLKTFYIIDQCLKDENGKNYALLSSSIDITERKLTEAELKKSQEELRKFSLYLLKVRENERTKISLEIHDSIAQFLVALKVDMGLYLRKMAGTVDNVKAEDVKTKIEELVAQVDNTLKSSRMIMNDLRPDQLDLLGFVEASEVHLHNFQEIHHIKCNFDNRVSGLNIQKEQSIVLFRILQESLSNILKHAKANSVSVKLTKTEASLIMEISDNGVGFNENSAPRPDAYGLISMKEQVKGLDGIFSMSSNAGKGTLVRVEIPCQ